MKQTKESSLEESKSQASGFVGQPADCVPPPKASQSLSWLCPYGSKWGRERKKQAEGLPSLLGIPVPAEGTRKAWVTLEFCNRTLCGRPPPTQTPPRRQAPDARAPSLLRHPMGTHYLQSSLWKTVRSCYPPPTPQKPKKSHAVLSKIAILLQSPLHDYRCPHTNHGC